MEAPVQKYCECPRNMPYFDWFHDRSCPLWVPLNEPATKEKGEQFPDGYKTE